MQTRSGASTVGGSTQTDEHWEEIDDTEVDYIGEHRYDEPLAEPTLLEGRRLGLRTKIRRSILLCAESSPIRCKAVEVSSTGMVVVGAGWLPQDQIVTLLLTAVNGETLELQARAVRPTKEGQALEFVGVTDDDRLSIAELMDSYRPPEA